MTENTYYIRVEEKIGQEPYNTRMLIEANSKDEVEEKYRKSVMDWGYFKVNEDKNLYSTGEKSIELKEVQELDEIESIVLKRFLQEWATV